jgi:hypothetical protein
VKVRPGQIWSTNDVKDARTRQWFEVISIDHENNRVAVRYVNCRFIRGGQKNLQQLEAGLRGSRLEKDSDGTAPVMRAPRATLSRLEKSTASDHRKVRAPKGLTKDERERWLRGELE